MILKLPVSYANYRWCPNLNLREISESESEPNSTHVKIVQLQYIQNKLVTFENCAFYALALG